MPKRLLALEVRASKFGFAVFEGPTRLLDWGTRSFENDNKILRSSVSERVGILLAFHKPYAVVVRLRTHRSGPRNKMFARIVNSIRSESKRHSARLVVLTTLQVRRAFASERKVVKHDVALAVARQFEELSWRLPHRRKLYETEPRAMAVFDAAANGIAYFRQIDPLGSDQRKDSL